MKSKTLAALKKSIVIWSDRANGLDVDKGCPLCKLFPDCIDCPVMLKTGKPSCSGTPFYKWAAKPTAANAKKELDFLKSLLPKKRRKK
jgi:hypothetical protein